MTRVYAALILTLFVGLLRGQSFTKWYVGEGLFVFQSLCPSADGGLIAQAHSFADDGSSLLIRTNPEGEPLWAKRYYFQPSDVGFIATSEIVAAPDSGIWVAGSKGAGGIIPSTIVFKVDVNGDLLWASELPQDGVVQGLDIVAHGNEALLTLTPSRRNLYLSRLSADGSILWGKNVTLPGYEDYFFCQITLSPDNRALVQFGVSHEQMGNDDVDFLLLTMDAATGQIAQIQLFEEPVLGTPAFDATGNLYLSFSVGGSQRLAKYSPDGAPLWCRQFNAGIHAIHPLEGGELKVLGSLNGVTALLNLSPVDGSLLWSRLYQTAYHTAFSLNEFNSTSVHFPDHHLAWLGRQQDERMTITRISPTGEIADCTIYSPCEIKAVDAPFPEFAPIAWVEEPRQQQSPLSLETADYNLTATPICNESWFSAGFNTREVVYAGDTLHFQQQPANFPVASEWAFRGGTPAASNEPVDTVLFLTPGAYSIQHIASAFGCRDTAAQTVNVLESPVFSLGQDTSLCEGDSLLLSSGLSSSTYALEWQDGSPDSIFLATASGIYFLSASNSIGCSRADSILVTFEPLPHVALGEDTVLCGGRTLLLQAQTDAAQPVYSWNTGAASAFLTATADSAYTLAITDAATGCQGQDSIFIGHAEAPLVRFPADTTFCPGELLVLAVQPLNNEVLEYRWEDDASEQNLTVMAPGSYSIQVSNGACDTSATIVVLPGDCRTSLFVPNAFSPNGDGRNDYFLPFGPDIELQRLRIFNRWGSLLYDEEGGGARWDGTIGGEKAPSGAYVFLLEYFNRRAENRATASGEILLVR